MDHQTSSIPPIAYNLPQSSTQLMTEFPQMGSSLDVPVFNQGDDPIDCLNKAMAFLTMATNQDGRFIVQQVQRRQGQSYAGTSYKGHMARQCTQPKRPRIAAWFKEKEMLAEAQESGQILDEAQLAFLADPGIPDGQVAPTTIPNTTTFQTEDLDAYDSDSDDVSNEKAVQMANLSHYGLDVILEWIKPTLYDGSVISSQHAASPVIDDEETLTLEEVSRSKMLAKQNDPMSKENKVNTTPINYVELNRLFKYFGKFFVPQQELSDEQAFGLQTSHPNTDQFASSPVKIEAPKELPKVSLVNASLKNLKYHLGQFNTVVEKRITPNVITEGEWGSVENADLKAQIQDKVFVITSLKNDLRKLKGKEIVENVAQIPIATTIAPSMFKLDLDPLAHRITPTKVVHLKETTFNSVETPKPEIKVYSRRPKQIKTVGSSKKAKIVESKNANNSEPNHSWGSNATDVPSSSSLVNDSKFLGTIRFENDQIAKIIGYGDYQLGNETISRVYYVEGLGHNLFFVGQFCDVDLEVVMQGMFELRLLWLSSRFFGQHVKSSV
ncbi:hypothetical protein Tco_0997427 [Tanacetum coccineum]